MVSMTTTWSRCGRILIAEAGTWTYQISGANELKLTVREDDPSASGESNLLLQPYLASGQSYNLDTVWQLVKGLYSNNSLNVTIADPITISEEQYQTVSDGFFNAETQALVTQGRADAVNIFLVDEVEGGGVLGIAAGIPGSLGIQGPHNGVLVSLGSHLSGLSSINLSMINYLLRPLFMRRGICLDCGIQQRITE